MTRSSSPYTTKPGSSEIHCFAYLPTPRLAILLPLRSTNRPSSSSTSLTLALAMLLLRCLGKGRNRHRWHPTPHFNAAALFDGGIPLFERVVKLFDGFTEVPLLDD